MGTWRVYEVMGYPQIIQSSWMIILVLPETSETPIHSYPPRKYVWQILLREWRLFLTLFLGGLRPIIVTGVSACFSNQLAGTTVDPLRNALFFLGGWWSFKCVLLIKTAWWFQRCLVAQKTTISLGFMVLNSYIGVINQIYTQGFKHEL